MIKLLRFLITGEWNKPPHEHKWQIEDQHEVFNQDKRKKNVTGIIYILKCAKCGEMKEFTVDANQHNSSTN